MTRRILVTGAGGFVGRRLVRRLGADGTSEVVALVRRAGVELPGACDVVVGDLESAEALARAVRGVSQVVHLAGRAHGTDLDDEALHRRAQLELTQRVFEAAASAGARRFVYGSSAAVYGAFPDAPVSEDAALAPRSAYGRFKAEAEAWLAVRGADRGVAVSVVRPPMVYGRGAGGPFARMVAGVRAGWMPAPPRRGARRSLVHVDDLVGALVALTSAARPGQPPDLRCYNVSDGHDRTARELHDAIRIALGRRPARFGLPGPLVRVGARVPGAGATLARLVEPARLDPARIRADLGWRPAVGLEDGLAEMLADGAGR